MGSLLANYSALFDASYYAHSCGRQYQRDAWWLNFFDQIAQHIVTSLQPASVLDAGCALGFLVEALRKRGVEAYGVDISEYAIQNVHQSIREFCWVGSASDPLPRRYDLIVSIEVLEHMPQADAELAIENFCRSADRVLFSSSPVDYKEATHFNVHPPEYWATQFARCGFFRDMELDGTFVTPWAVCFQKKQEPLWRLVAGYERQLWHRSQDSNAQRAVNLEQRALLAKQNEEILEQRLALARMSGAMRALDLRWAQLESSPGWTVLGKLQKLRAAVAPPASTRDRALEHLRQAWKMRDLAHLGSAIRLLATDVQRLVRRPQKSPASGALALPVRAWTPRPAIPAHQATVDIVVCVHDALNYVQPCLDSVLHDTQPPYRLIIVDDGSGLETRAFLADFVNGHPGAHLIQNDDARGYTFAANQGLRLATAEYVVLLNSDTNVTDGWLDRLLACAESDAHIGLVGPLSNTASWQSIPQLEQDGDWAPNPLPPGVSVEAMGRLVARYAARSYPVLPFLNGFCLLIKHRVIEQIGTFDEATFGAGYGEENDYCLRARQAGWQLALADDAYVYHAQGKSYSDARRQQLCEQADRVLANKHGHTLIQDGVAYCRENRVLQGIRAHSRVMVEQEEWIRQGQRRFAGRRVLFVLPVMDPGGGGGVVVRTAQVMSDMGVQADIFNLAANRDIFERAYLLGDLLVSYGVQADLVALAAQYDAVVATAHVSVEWLVPVAEHHPNIRYGYFIQDFEPYFYLPYSPEFKAALHSYARFPSLVHFTTTSWIREQVERQLGVTCGLVGPSFDLNLFRPRPRSAEWPDRRLRVAAMIRPDSPRRGPRFTMEVLRQIATAYGDSADIWLFGIDAHSLEFLELPHDFAFQSAGKLNREQMVSFMNEVDIFADLSTYQALGITALEAMACGVVPVVPLTGGAASFARDGVNCLVADTASQESCVAALRRLIEDHSLRARLQQQGIIDACAFYLEGPACNMLASLFEIGTA